MSTRAARRSAITDAERRDFRCYAWGLALAALLTVLPFALVHWQLLPRTPMLVLTGLFALVQAVVHFRFFLHIGLKRKREDLLLILFSTGLLIILAGGTIWIMANLATRMALPM